MINEQEIRNLVTIALSDLSNVREDLRNPENIDKPTFLCLDRAMRYLRQIAYLYDKDRREIPAPLSQYHNYDSNKAFITLARQ